MIKLFYLILCAICSFSSYANQISSTINQGKDEAAQLTCQQTILAYTKLRDNGPIEAYGALFTQDAQFEVKQHDILLQGRSQITKRLETALKKTKTHHVVTNIRIEPTAKNNYKAYSDFTLDLKILPPKKSASIAITGYYDDLLQFNGKNCLIVSRKVIIEYQHPKT